MFCLPQQDIGCSAKSRYYANRQAQSCLFAI
nr:MAG TPA: hypothetical protein [Caudoviricetes sp.]DAV89885.1 MAG TPA: hypothetical protein [Caudoviricetes sp.]